MGRAMTGTVPGFKQTMELGGGEPLFVKMHCTPPTILSIAQSKHGNDSDDDDDDDDDI